MNTYLHQLYIRRWAKKWKVPIFSVDYGKAPQYPFPQALEDCLEAYLWLLDHVVDIFSCKRVSIVLIGDSSGGNLAASLLNFLITHDISLPSLIILFYPALRLQLFYTPSFILGIDDMILPHSTLLKIKQSYVGSYPRPDSIYINPLYATR